MLTIYLTVTLCLASDPGVCRDYRFKSNDENMNSCLSEGMRQSMKLLKKDGEMWKIKKWRCSHRAPDLGV